MTRRLQVQDDLFIIRGSVRAATGVWITLIGPTCEVPSGVLVVVSTRPQRNEWLVVDEDLLDTHDRLLLHRGICGRGVLIQEPVSCRIVPGHEIELTLTNLSTVQILVVQVERCRATNHTTEHQL